MTTEAAPLQASDTTAKELFVLGGGGHAKVVIDSLRSAAIVVAGIIDPRLQPGERLMEVQVAGGDDFLSTRDPVRTQLANGVGATVKSRVNRKLFEAWTARGFTFVTVVHASATIAGDVRLDGGAQVMAGAVVQPYAHIGAGTVINTGCRVDHDCVVAEHCFIAPSVTLCGGVTIGGGTFVGAGAVLLPGVKVGQNALVAAGAIVDTDVGDGEYFQRSRAGG